MALTCYYREKVIVLGYSAVRNESGDPARIVIGDNTRLINAVITCKENAQVTVVEYCVLQSGSSINALERIPIGNYVGIAAGTSITDDNTHAVGTENWIHHRISVAPGGLGYSGLGNGWEIADSAPVHIEDAV